MRSGIAVDFTTHSNSEEFMENWGQQNSTYAVTCDAMMEAEPGRNLAGN